MVPLLNPFHKLVSCSPALPHLPTQEVELYQFEPLCPPPMDSRDEMKANESAARPTHSQGWRRRGVRRASEQHRDRASPCPAFAGCRKNCATHLSDRGDVELGACPPKRIGAWRPCPNPLLPDRTWADLLQRVEACQARQKHDDRAVHNGEGGDPGLRPPVRHAR